MFERSLLWNKLLFWGYRLRCCDQKTQINGNFKKRFLHRSSRLQHVLHLWVQGGFCSSWHHIYTPTSIKGGNTMDVHMQPFWVWIWMYHISFLLISHCLNKITLPRLATKRAKKQWFYLAGATFFMPRKNSSWVEEKNKYWKTVDCCSYFELEKKYFNSTICT